MSINSPIECLIERLDTLMPLTEDDRAALRELPTTVQSVGAGRQLMVEGDAPGPCAVMMEGFAVRHKIMSTGTRQILSLHIPGDALGLQLLFLDVADHNIQTLCRSKVAFVPLQSLRQIALGHRAIAAAFFASTAVESATLRQWIVNLGCRDAEARVAHFLCELAVRLNSSVSGDDTTFECPLTQEQMGDALGLTNVHVNRVLRGFDKQGLLERNGRRVAITRWREFCDVAGFHSRYLYLP